MADPPKVRNIASKNVYKELREAGIAAEPLLEEAGLQMYQLNLDDGWLPYEGHARLFEAAAREFKDPYYGLHFAQRTDTRDFGALAYVGLSSRTLEDALRNLERYARVQTEAWTFKLTMENRSAILAFTPARTDFELYPQAAEAAIGVLIHAFQYFLSQPLAPREIQFVHSIGPADNKKSRCEQLLGCPVKFGQSHYRIVLDGTSLQLPIGTADDRLLKVLKAHCASVLEQPKARQSDLVARTGDTIVNLLSSGRAKAKLVASEIGMTERTLHRRLAGEGTSFGEIHESLRRDLADKYMKEQGLNVKTVAFLLGYADQSAFGVAFKRWTGRTPREERAVAH